MIIRIFIALALGIVLGPVLCFFSGRITMETDGSQGDTIGMLYGNGFPVWYRESAPGLSVAGGLHFDRLEINTAIWMFVVFLVTLGILWFSRKGYLTDPSTRD